MQKDAGSRTEMHRAVHLDAAVSERENGWTKPREAVDHYKSGQRYSRNMGNGLGVQDQDGCMIGICTHYTHALLK